MESDPDEVYYLESIEEGDGRRLLSSEGSVRESYSFEEAEARLYQDELTGDWYAKIHFEEGREEARERLEKFAEFVEEEYDTDFRPSFRRFDRMADSSSGVRQRCRVAPLTETVFRYTEEDFEPDEYPDHVNRLVGGVALGSLVSYGVAGAAAGTAFAGPAGFAPGLMAGVTGWYTELEADTDRSPVSLLLRGLENRVDRQYSLENEELFEQLNAVRDPEMQYEGLLRDEREMRRELSARVELLDAIQFQSIEDREGSTLMLHGEEYRDAAGFVESLLDVDLPDREPVLREHPEAVESLLSRMREAGRRELIAELMSGEVDEEVAAVLDETYGETVEAVGVETML